VVEYLLSKHEALSSNPSTTEKVITSLPLTDHPKTHLKVDLFTSPNIFFLREWKKV
jgi:hypothetical protein